MNLFPSAFIRRAFAKSAEFSLGYSKRINRASAENLNPFTSYADPYNLRRGNPALGPEYIHSIDLSVELTRKKWSINGSLYQRFSNNVIQRVRVFYADGTSAGTLANIDKSISTGGELVFQVKPIPTWRNTLSGNANYIVFTDNTTGVNYNREGFVWGLKLTSLVELMKKTLTVQVNGRYNAPAVSPSGKFNPRGSVDFSIDKSFKEGKWGVGARLTDVFNTQSFSFVADQGNSVFTTSFKQQTRRFYINVRYKFGKTELNDRKKSGDSPSGGGGGFDF